MNDLSVLPDDLPIIKRYGRPYVQAVRDAVLANIVNLESGRIYTAKLLLGSEAWEATSEQEHKDIGRIMVVLAEFECLPIVDKGIRGDNHHIYLLL